MTHVSRTILAVITLMLATASVRAELLADQRAFFFLSGTLTDPTSNAVNGVTATIRSGRFHAASLVTEYTVEDRPVSASFTITVENATSVEIAFRADGYSAATWQGVFSTAYERWIRDLKGRPPADAALHPPPFHVEERDVRFVLKKRVGPPAKPLPDAIYLAVTTNSPVSRMRYETPPFELSLVLTNRGSGFVVLLAAPSGGGIVTADPVALDEAPGGGYGGSIDLQATEHVQSVNFWVKHPGGSYARVRSLLTWWKDDLKAELESIDALVQTNGTMGFDLSL